MQLLQFASAGSYSIFKCLSQRNHSPSPITTCNIFAILSHEGVEEGPGSYKPCRPDRRNTAPRTANFLHFSTKMVHSIKILCFAYVFTVSQHILGIVRRMLFALFHLCFALNPLPAYLPPTTNSFVVTLPAYTASAYSICESMISYACHKIFGSL